MKKIEVVAAIIKKDDFYLIAQRLKGEFAGLWEFPGGKHLGKYEECIKREAFITIRRFNLTDIAYT